MGRNVFLCRWVRASLLLSIASSLDVVFQLGKDDMDLRERIVFFCSWKEEFLVGHL